MIFGFTPGKYEEFSFNDFYYFDGTMSYETVMDITGKGIFQSATISPNGTNYGYAYIKITIDGIVIWETCARNSTVGIAAPEHTFGTNGNDSSIAYLNMIGALNSSQQSFLYVGGRIPYDSLPYVNTSTSNDAKWFNNLLGIPFETSCKVEIKNAAGSSAPNTYVAIKGVVEL